jgi:hypothetical protein
MTTISIYLYLIIRYLRVSFIGVSGGVPKIGAHSGSEPASNIIRVAD